MQFNPLSFLSIILISLSSIRSEANYIEFGSQEHKDIVAKNFGPPKAAKTIPKLNNLLQKHYIVTDVTDLGEALECVYTNECIAMEI